MTGSPLAPIRSAWSASVASLGTTAGAGVDLVDTSEFASLLAAGGSAFLDNGWSPQEQRDAEGSAERLAVRWAGKEAVMKALHCGLGDLDPLDIEILTGRDGSPAVVLHRNALAAASTLRVRDWHLSLCHEEGWAVAIAIANRQPFAAGPAQRHEGNGHA